MKIIPLWCLFLSILADAEPDLANKNATSAMSDQIIFLDPFSIDIINNNLLADTSNFGLVPQEKIQLLKQKVIHACKQNKFLMINLGLLKSPRGNASSLKGQVGISQQNVIRDLSSFARNNFKIKSSRGCWNTQTYLINDQKLDFHLFPLAWRLVFLELLHNSAITHIQLSLEAITDPKKYHDLPATFVFKGSTELIQY